MKRKIERSELREVLNLVKSKLVRNMQGACGMMWSDSGGDQSESGNEVYEPDVEQTITTYYAVGEEDGGKETKPITRYSIGE